jgi:hypothetical protein
MHGERDAYETTRAAVKRKSFSTPALIDRPSAADGGRTRAGASRARRGSAGSPRNAAALDHCVPTRHPNGLPGGILADGYTKPDADRAHLLEQRACPEREHRTVERLEGVACEPERSQLLVGERQMILPAEPVHHARQEPRHLTAAADASCRRGAPLARPSAALLGQIAGFGPSSRGARCTSRAPARDGTRTPQSPLPACRVGAPPRASRDDGLARFAARAAPSQATRFKS